MPKDLVAQILIDTILQYPYSTGLLSQGHPYCHVLTSETFQPFLHYAQKVLESSPCGITKQFNIPDPLQLQLLQPLKNLHLLPPASSIPTSELDVVEIPLGKTHHRLVLKKGHLWLYEDADIQDCCHLQ